jgi:hypothetical protein
VAANKGGLVSLLLVMCVITAMCGLRAAHVDSSIAL